MRLRVCCAWAMLLARAACEQAPGSHNTAAPRHTLSAAAVAAALTDAGLPVAPARVHLPGVLSARSEMPALTVIAAEQHGTAALAVRIRCRDASECMPFFATVDEAGDHEALAAFAARSFAPARETARSAAAGVTVGARITLELADARMRINLPAIAIDTGAPGAEIRVASLDRKHTWRGVVVDATTVRGGVQ